MNYCYRFAINFVLIVALGCFLTPPLHSEQTFTTVKARDFLQIGINNIQLGNYRQSIQNFTQAIELKSDFAAAYNDRCLSYLQLEDYRNAIADCTSAITFSPDNTEAYLNRGVAQYRLGKYQAAIADHNQVIKLKSDFRAYYNRGLASAALGNHQQAISDYDLALTQNSHISSFLLADIYNDKGLANFELQDFSDALLNFSSAILLNPEDYRGYFNRGYVCAKSGDGWGAVRDFTEVTKLKPDNILAYVNRGVAYYNLEREQAAIKDLQTAAASFGDRHDSISYQKVIDLLETMQQQISFRTQIALGDRLEILPLI